MFKTTTILIVGLMAMTALLAGCTSPQGENTNMNQPNPEPEGEPLETGEVDGDEAKPTDKTANSPGQPPEPVVVQSASPMNMQIMLLWSAPSSNGSGPLTAYNVYRAHAIEGSYELVHVANSEDTFWIDTEVGVGGVYYYRMGAVNEYGENLPANGGTVWSSTYSMTNMQPLPTEVPGYHTLNLAAGGWSEFWKLGADTRGGWLINTMSVPYTICFYQVEDNWENSNSCEYRGYRLLEESQNDLHQGAWFPVGYQSGDAGQYFRIRLDFPGVALMAGTSGERG